TNPAHGSVAVGTGGTLTYTPTAGYNGQDMFAYTVTDNQGAVSTPAQVTVTVTPAVTVSPPAAKGGGGGSIDYLDIAGLLALFGANWLVGPISGRRREAEIASTSS